MHATKILKAIIRKVSVALFPVFFIGLIIIIAYPMITGKSLVAWGNVFVFDGVSGPVSVDIIADEQPARWQKYDGGSSSRLAILLTDKNSAWLGLVHGLKTVGVPFRITTNVDEAITHKLVLIYPIVSGKVLDSSEIKKIADYSRGGGNIIGVNVLGGGLQSIFGFKSVKSSRDHYQLELQNTHAVTQHLADKDLRTIRLSTQQLNDLSFGTHSYMSPKHEPLALYNDGTPAIVYNKFSRSEVYAIGFDIGFYMLKAYNRRMENVATTYANGFEASVDNLLQFIKTLYQHHEPNAVTLGTVPHGQSLSVILSHDIDYNRSLKNALVYAKHEFDNNISATHFIQTKYIRDWNDEVFFDDEGSEYINQLEALDVELASHSVAHSLKFHEFEIGNGNEQYPTYTPFVKDELITYDGSIMGELRVSKFLIEHFAPENKVISFRPGHLSNPLTLPQALQATGYRYSSSVTANVSLSHLPFKLNYNRDINSEVDVYEFPITVEDELPPDLGNRLDEAIELAHKIRRYGGLFVVLIHPNILGHKLEFQRGFVKAMRPYAWFGSLSQFGKWWSVRDQLSMDVENTGKNKRVVLDVPETINGLVINIPESWRLLITVPESLHATQRESSVILGNVQGRAELVFNQANDK
jgi:hypothetical protein